jgi:hypothetical protein
MVLPSITGIEVFAGGSGGFPAQPGYQRLPFDLNKGASGKFIQLRVLHQNPQT